MQDEILRYHFVMDIPHMVILDRSQSWASALLTKKNRIICWKKKNPALFSWIHNRFGLGWERDRHN